MFYGQTYENKELVILDDADDPSFPGGVDHPQVRYLSNWDHALIPAKRNHCCEWANGEIIWSLDSDDWSAPTRMEEQVKMLLASGKQLTGYHSMLFYDVTSGKATKYQGKGCALGSSQCYFKSWWRRYPYRLDKPIASDTTFSGDALRAGQLHCVDGEQMMVARIHAGNSAPKRPDRWKQMQVSDLPECFLQLHAVTA